jgi:succinate-acetate transporter protein
VAYLYPSYFAPFVLLYGGIIQLLAAMWAFRARYASKLNCTVGGGC